MVLLTRARPLPLLCGWRRERWVDPYMNCWASTDKAAFKPVPVEVSLLIKEPQAAPLMAAAALNWQQAAARWQEYRTELEINPDAKPPAALG